jgi:hypothetical protein
MTLSHVQPSPRWASPSGSLDNNGTNPVVSKASEDKGMNFETWEGYTEDGNPRT